MTLVYQEPLVDVYRGHVLDVLAALEPQSVQTCVTSPPYFGLRSYSVEPQIWGGSTICEHLWCDEKMIRKGSTNGREDFGSTLVSAGALKTLAPGKQNDHGETKQYRTDSSQTCSICGAWKGQLGLEKMPFCTDAMLGRDCTDACYLGHLLQVCDGLWRVVRDDGTFWLNMGDSYANTGNPHGSGMNGLGRELGHMRASKVNRRIREGGYTQPAKAIPAGLKSKDLIGLPWRTALALQARGWTLRSEIKWLKGSAMPESVQDRPTVSHETVFLFSKGPKYFWDAEAIREPHKDWKGGGHKRADHHKYSLPLNGQPQIRQERHEDIINPNGRNRRTADWWYESLDRLITDTEAWLDHAKQVRANGGMLLSPDGEPLGLNVNPQPFSEWQQTSRHVPVERDAVDGDTKRTTSPDCPVHGDHSAQVSNAPYDAHAADDQNHISHIDGRLVPELLRDSGPSDQTDASDYVGERKDCSLPSYDLFATDHNSEIHKTAHAPETTQPCRPSAEMDHDTGHIPALLEKDGHADHTGESKSARGDWDAHPSAENSAHTRHTSSSVIPPQCICSFYKEVTDKSSHFATFPPNLVRPMVLASTSERGACQTCQSPYQRVVEQHSPPNLGRGRQSWTSGSAMGQPQRDNHGAFHPVAPSTLGWHPTCRCHEYTTDAGWRASHWPLPEPQPCVVLDPFSGAATTLLVARALGRKSIGIELSDAYVKLSIKRLRQQVLPFDDVSTTVASNEPVQDAMTFDA